jgi:phage/plasmid primase-like uncharacterized protein
MVAGENLKGEIIQLILSRKGGGANFACGGYNKQLFHPENQGAYLQNG